jgi:hypothetical protein
MQTASASNPGNTASSTTIDPDCGLWSVVAPEREPIDWAYFVVMNELPSGESVHLGRLHRTANPTEDHIKELLPPPVPGTGGLFTLTLDFRDAGGTRRGKAPLSLYGRSTTPAPAPTAIELAKTTPGFQFAEMHRDQGQLILKLVEHTIAMGRDHATQAAKAREAEMAAMQSLFDKLAETLGSVEGAKAVDPTTAMVKAAAPYAKKVADWAMGQGAVFVMENGGVKPALAKLVTMFAGGAKSEAFDKILQVLGAVAPSLGIGEGEE